MTDEELKKATEDLGRQLSWCTTTSIWMNNDECINAIKKSLAAVARSARTEGYAQAIGDAEKAISEARECAADNDHQYGLSDAIMTIRALAPAPSSPEPSKAVDLHEPIESREALLGGDYPEPNAPKAFDAEAKQEFADMARVELEGGAFRHYKGGLYDVVCVSVSEATGEVLVTYRSRDKDYYWTRTLTNFQEKVGEAPRFERIGEALPQPESGKAECAGCEEKLNRIHQYIAAVTDLHGEKTAAEQERDALRARVERLERCARTARVVCEKAMFSAKRAVLITDKEFEALTDALIALDAGDKEGRDG